MALQRPVQSVTGHPQAPLGDLHDRDLRPDGLLIEAGQDGREYTRLCPVGHWRASRTVSDPVDLLGWVCPICEIEGETLESLRRYRVVRERLASRGR